jgi:hypothetical protein
VTELVLTDDEVVAVAVEHGGGWPTALPSVDAGDGVAVREAAWRGRRSLAVRGLVGADAGDDVTLDCVRRDAVGARAVLGLHVGGDPVHRTPPPFVVDAYACGSEWLVDTVSEHGVHGFRHFTHDALIDLMTALAGDAFRRGVDDGSGAARLWVAVAADGPRPALRVSAGHASLVGLVRDRVEVGTERPVTDLRSEVVHLARRVRHDAGHALVGQ